PLGGDLLGGRENPDSNGKVECRAVFSNVRRGEVDGDTLQGEGVTRVGERRVHALAALLYSTLRQPDGGERGEAVRDVGLDVDEIGVDAEHRGGADAGEHDLTPCPPLRFAERGDAMTPSVHSSDGTMLDGFTGVSSNRRKAGRLVADLTP